ncbi:MAG: sugar ABC transporter permease, partial [Chloroflexota bacterium]|nr:sugar ABC transporter permease [Chloroflexota bacterium]
GLAGRQRRDGWLMAAPAIVAILGLGLFPLVYSLALSFRRWDLQVPGRPWIGLDNYAAALGDDRVWAALRNTLLLSVGGVALQFVLGLGLALVLIDELRGKRFVIPLLMLPTMMVPVVVALGWRLLWDATYGPVNHLLGFLSGRDVQIAWFSQADTALVAILVTEVWQWTPFMFLILLAALAGVNADLYDAAALDGAGWWRTLRDITLPAIGPVVAVALLFRWMDAFKVFDLVYMFTQGGPGTSTETLSWYVYQLGFKFFRMGYAAALSYLVVVFLTVVATVYAARWLREERP